MTPFFFFFFFFNDTATTEIYTLSLHDALPVFVPRASDPPHGDGFPTLALGGCGGRRTDRGRCGHRGVRGPAAGRAASTERPVSRGGTSGRVMEGASPGCAHAGVADGRVAGVPVRTAAAIPQLAAPGGDSRAVVVHAIIDTAG